ncbi:transport and Golgi organization protein 2 isoform X2 [Belonocnema kinseyi]|uniref:transport and Golgi organization protein 2 isoform X2 n=1 Tax=Belonocnema kinseyi TaxID=2817044 RepID=UPI00143D5B73|nr:transport and Golgi organization protein 2 isoform X2 [Belonocnema kinseyi]
MCILFIYRDPEANADSYRLIIASNRDEFFARPAKPAHYWGKYPYCLGGTDMEPGREGGTWLAISTKGRVGVTLNLRGETRNSDTPAEGRGFLITDYLVSHESTETYLNKLHKINQDTQKYNPYTLVLIELKTANVAWLSSRLESKGPQSCNGNIFGFGNSPVDQPYKKVEVGKEKFKKIVENTSVTQQSHLVENLLDFLKWRERHLPDEILKTQSPQVYPDLSSIFVHSEKAEYGTRTHSILLVDGSGKMTFVEETLMPDRTWKTQNFKAFL